MKHSFSGTLITEIKVLFVISYTISIISSKVAAHASLGLNTPNSAHACCASVRFSCSAYNHILLKQQVAVSAMHFCLGHVLIDTGLLATRIKLSL